MRTAITLFAVALASLLPEAHARASQRSAASQSSRGACLTRSRASSVFVVQSNVRFVPFAIPVAVPVAVVNVPSVVYGYSGYSARYAPGGGVEPRELVHQQTTPQKPQLTAGEVVTNRCTKCHSGDEPKGGFSLDDMELDSLDRDTRYSMLLRIMEPDKRKRMPKGGELSREEFDVLVDALVR